MVKKVKISPSLFEEWRHHPVTTNLILNLQERLQYCYDSLFNSDIFYSERYERHVASLIAEVDLLKGILEEVTDYKIANQSVPTKEAHEMEVE